MAHLLATHVDHHLVGYPLIAHVGLVVFHAVNGLVSLVSGLLVDRGLRGFGHVVGVGHALGNLLVGQAGVVHPHGHAHLLRRDPLV